LEREEKRGNYFWNNERNYGGRRTIQEKCVTGEKGRERRSFNSIIKRKGERGENRHLANLLGEKIGRFILCSKSTGGRKGVFPIPSGGGKEGEGGTKVLIQS